MTGTVYLVGAGPGSADLLTLRAARLLAEAELVMHDALVSEDVLALAPHARKLNVGKRAGRHSTDQAVINRLLVRAARRHRVVVRLKGGDPMLFGRAQEEIAALEAAGVAYEVVPGITAALAAAAAIGTSLSQRGNVRSVAFATPRVGADETASAWATGLAAADAGAIYMGLGQADLITATLIAQGKPASLPVAVVENASLPGQRVRYATLAELPHLALTEVEGPALILLGPQFTARARVAVHDEVRCRMRMQVAAG